MYFDFGSPAIIPRVFWVTSACISSRMPKGLLTLIGLTFCQPVQCELTFLLRMPKGLPVGLSQLILAVNLEISLETSGAIIPRCIVHSLRMPKGLPTLIVSTLGC
jgi:hypothetical protein